MRPLMEILEDERNLMLKLETIHQNMLRYPGQDAYEVLTARKGFIERDLGKVRGELKEYIAELFK